MLYDLILPHRVLKLSTNSSFYQIFSKDLFIADDMLYWRLRIQRQIKQIFVIKEYVLMSIDAIIAKLGGRSSSLAMIFLATLLYTQLAMAFLATLLHAHKGGQVHGFLCY